MNITEITKKAGAKPKRKRVGRGESSGWGKTSGRGHKGQGQRAGYTAMSLREGANFPFFRRIPKYGFSNEIFRTEYQIVNLSELSAKFDKGAHVTPAELESKGLVRDKDQLVKVLGDGELSGGMTIEAHRFSASAEKKIQAAGGTAKWLADRPKKKFVRKPKWQIEAEAKAAGIELPKGGAKKKSAKKGDDGDAPEEAKAPKATKKAKDAPDAPKGDASADE
ncbi:MAG: 50S ribosomal protein L15 [Phycisphaerales bacterium]|nr:50S ribosomal protein L15 [Phycisphaerales bacterium]MCB9854836.1 50S ribosomal protein L15 [Phycisphaerales bacterium]